MHVVDSIVKREGRQIQRPSGRSRRNNRDGERNVLPSPCLQGATLYTPVLRWEVHPCFYSGGPLRAAGVNHRPDYMPPSQGESQPILFVRLHLNNRTNHHCHGVIDVHRCFGSFDRHHARITRHSPPSPELVTFPPSADDRIYSDEPSFGLIRGRPLQAVTVKRLQTISCYPLQPDMSRI